jgi:alpha-D-ribose 1-methylphosphonate 5-triphosphate synthase subunit PhnH
MKTEELQQVRPGFHDVAIGSQAVFRVALEALSHPGRVLTVPAVSASPSQGHAAAAMLLQALADSDCSVWLSAALAKSDAAAWLRFHTGCRWAHTPEAARFLWVAQGDAIPPLFALDAGSDEYPDLSATLVLEVPVLANAALPDAPAWCLQGPGIRDTQNLTVRGLPENFVDQWARGQSRFPRGVDLFLASSTQLAGLPRTTRILATTEA